MVSWSNDCIEILLPSPPWISCVCPVKRFWFNFYNWSFWFFIVASCCCPIDNSWRSVLWSSNTWTSCGIGRSVCWWGWWPWIAATCSQPILPLLVFFVCYRYETRSCPMLLFCRLWWGSKHRRWSVCRWRPRCWQRPGCWRRHNCWWRCCCRWRCRGRVKSSLIISSRNICRCKCR